MKKIRLIASIMFVVMLCCALAVFASANWWEENPFSDVKSSSWYYDAVRICNENGLFKGTTETTFGTSIGMDRAMLVTVLAAGDESFDAGKYTTSSFSDIRDGSWYMAAVEWANEKGIASGIADGAFGPKNTVTRQELALMLMKYAEYKEMDVTVSEETDISSYPDANTVSSWAADAVKWAVQNGLISGTAQGDKIMLSPKGTATRATVAQIMVKFLALDPVRTINGNDISLYTIVYSNDEISKVEEAANALSKFIEKSIGVKLPVVTDEAEITDYEILVGKTNREDNGLVSVDLEALDDHQKFICQVQGNYLVIQGTDSDSDNDKGERNTYNVQGTYNAVFYFLEKVMGYTFYFDDEGTIINPDPVIALDDGFTYIDGPAFETRSYYLSGEDCELDLDCGNYYSEWGCGLPHQLGNLLTGAWRETYANTWDTPCLSDPANIESLLKNVRELLAEKPTMNLIGLVQNDSDYYCRCPGCSELYRVYGSRCGAVLNICNIVAEMLEEEYPNVRVATWAYTWSAKPPKAGTYLHENVIVYYNTLVLCPAHAYSDTSCSFNKTSAEYIKSWGEIASDLYVWDHTGAFTCAMTPFPDFDSMRINAKYFEDNGVQGGFMNGMTGQLSDFCELRKFIFGRLWCDPNMSEEEFDFYVNGFLKCFYGEGWASLRAYIDTVTKLANSNCHVFHAVTSAYYNYDEVRPFVDIIERYWDDAEAKATGDQLERVKVSRLSWTYLKQCALYETQYKNGDAASRAIYMEENQKLYDDIIKYDVIFSENGDMTYFSQASSPETWG